MRAALALLAGWLLAGTASAQVSFNLSAVSDYRFRGISQSAGDPAVQGSVAFDHPVGVFAGLFASTIDLGAASSDTFEAFVNAGYARRVDPDLSWELGAGYYTYHGSGRVPDWDYAEGSVGVTWRTLGARLSYAPDYYKRSTRLAYLELNTSHPINERAALFAHFGVTRLAGDLVDRGSAERARVDVRFGVSVDLIVVSLEVSAVATDIAADNCPGAAGADGCEPGLVVAVSRSF